MSPSTAGFRHGSCAHQRAAQTGFSLVEVLIGIAIAALLSGIVASALFLTGRSASSSSDSLVSSNSAFRTSARFADDVAGAGPVADVTSGFVTSGELGCGGSPAVVRLVGPGSPASTVQVRSYEVAGAPTAPTLIRSECTGASLTAALASAAASTEVVPNLATTDPVTALCNGEAFESGVECDFVSLSIVTATGWSYTLDASVRASRTPTMVTLPNPSPFERTYADSPGGTFEVTVPAYKTVTFELWGGSGGGGQHGSRPTGPAAPGGQGGFSTYVTGTIPASASAYTLYVALGEGGRGGSDASRAGGHSAYGSGGDGGNRASNNGGFGGGGGGASAISNHSTFNAGSILIVAAGGGGGGGGTFNNGNFGGEGGRGPIHEVSISSASATPGIKGGRGWADGNQNKAEGGSPGGATAEGPVLATRTGGNAGAAGSGSNGGQGGNAWTGSGQDSGGGGGGGGGRWGSGGGEGARRHGGQGNHGGGGGGGGSAIAVGVLAPWADWGFQGGAPGPSKHDRAGGNGTDGKVILRFS